MGVMTEIVVNLDIDITLLHIVCESKSECDCRDALAVLAVDRVWQFAAHCIGLLLAAC